MVTLVMLMSMVRVDEGSMFSFFLGVGLNSNKEGTMA